MLKATSEGKKTTKTTTGKAPAPVGVDPPRQVFPPRGMRVVAPAQTPPPSAPPKQPCPHKYALAETVKNAYDNKDGMTTWTRVDRFFCQICLDQKEIMKSEMRKQKPEWY